MLDQGTGLRILAEEVLADISPALASVFLKFAIHDFVHALDKLAALVAGEERVPIASPDDFDDVPSRASESRFQLLDDLTVAADRTIESLQIAVDDEYQVVETLA